MGMKGEDQGRGENRGWGCRGRIKEGERRGNEER